ncbi:MAG: undecaprenyl-diphosphate phosphatase [Rhodobacterales bacterium]|nr:undecaprenyl-diphosphate phosphatase [Rhodobacterales bacterium]
MSFLQIVVLALVQGITEFLPISSSGHLVLVPYFGGWPDQGLLMDVAVHVGTLGAVVIYFWRDLWDMLVGLGRLLRGRRDPRAMLVIYLILATIPVVIAGFLVNAYAGDALRSIAVIGWTTLGFGIVLYVTDRLGMTLRTLDHIGWRDALVVGLAQVLALVPGTSRSGITMSAARMLGMERSDAARFSMLLSIPTILGAGLLKGKELYDSGNAALTFDAILAAGLSMVAALIAVALMMAWLKRATFTPFVVYRVVLGVVLLALAYGVV